MNKKFITLLLLINFNANSDSLLIRLEPKIYQKSIQEIKNLENNIIFKNIFKEEWYTTSVNVSHFTPQIENQKANFIQNYTEYQNQERKINYIYTDINTGIDFVKETKKESRILENHYSREISVEKVSEYISDINNCS